MTFQQDNIHGNFSPVADAYVKGRREYPQQVIDWVRRCIRGDRVIDLGCGTGISSRQLARVGFQVTGIDSSDLMLNKARHGKEDVHYIMARTESLPFSEEHFDGATAFTAFHWFNSPAATNEVKRVLKANSPFCVVHGLPGKSIDDPIHHRPIIEQIVGRKLPNSYEQYDPEKSLRDFGLQRVSSDNFVYTEQRDIEEFLLYWQSVSLWNYIPADKRSYALDTFRKHLKKYFPDGIVKRTMNYIMVIGYKS